MQSFVVNFCCYEEILDTLLENGFRFIRLNLVTSTILLRNGFVNWGEHANIGSFWFVTKELSYGFNWFFSIASGHVKIHKNELIGWLGLKPSLLYNGYGLFAIDHSVTVQVKLLDLCLKSQAAESIVFNDQYLGVVLSYNQWIQI